MLKFLFWNINNKPLSSLIVDSVTEFEVDILILAESNLDPTFLLTDLNIATQGQFAYDFRSRGRIQLFTRFPVNWIDTVREDYRTTSYNLNHRFDGELLIVAVHLPSKLHMSPDDYFSEATRLRRRIESMEVEFGHDRTVLVGDFNMNPFEPAVVASEGLHGVMDQRTARTENRIVRGESRRFFYNPMWSKFGDGTEGPPGTYYYNSSDDTNYFWHVFDQVLLRPSLLYAFSHDDLIVITDIGSTSLLGPNGRPDTSIGSDHLPLWFNLNL